ncbi:sigma-54 dependent transcriptional regulator [Desulfuromonas sp. AOP6]|uniref:sigma-54-dependent transcriptional regulator n=1 Tax=Desulfuromonas sp. AOP6 TaxID=1566351 RepID=UPI00127651B2|nr:sigma-54 dependent transcriptional regulator [Desulfuromonas sp. AOP6]BCA80788.1 Fis family transcriptional regulator [Desulfuromonas sp. AOP6]
MRKGDANILVVDDESVIREGVRRILLQEGYQVETSSSGNLALERMQSADFDLVITDLKMPGMSGMEVLKAIRILQPDVPVVIITGYSTVETAVEAMKFGAFDYLAKPFTPEQILHLAESALKHRITQIEKAVRGDSPGKHPGFDLFVGESRQMERVYRRILQVAPTDSTVLITGESGTGKELLARAIHNHSSRKDQPFLAVDCTSLAESLLESELFGHMKGSFTGAVQSKVGLFKVADGGTLFLDEVSNISLTTQAKLLRVLQEREITPVGGNKPVPINIRLIAATNRNLREMCAKGEFREDLFFRLNIIPVDLPPLRERQSDIPLLTRFFLEKFARELGKEIRGLSPAAMEHLNQHAFPGNVRELENILERAVVLAEGSVIEIDNLELSGQTKEDGAPFCQFIPKTAEELKETKQKIREMAVMPVEKAFVLDALERNNWNVTRAAEEVGMLRPNFQALLKKQGISIRDRLPG